MDTLAPAPGPVSPARLRPTGAVGADEALVPLLKTGDVLLIRTGSGIGRIVRALDRSAFNHCAIHIGDRRCVHVLPPKALRGRCVVIQSFEDMVATLGPQAIEVRRPPSDLAEPLASGAVAQHSLGPAFSHNDLLLLATVADTSDRLANAIAPIGDFLSGQDDWEALLGAHFGLAGPEAITCSGLVIRSLPDSVQPTVARARRHVPEAWQEAIRPDEPLATDVEAILGQTALGSPRLHRRRGYTPLIAALDRFAVDSGRDDLGTAQLRVALTVLRHLAADYNERTPFDLHRLREVVATVLDTERGEWLARLTTPGDLARATTHLAPTGLTWSAPAGADTRTPPSTPAQLRRSSAAPANA